MSSKKETQKRILISFLINLGIICLAVFVFGTKIWQDDDNIMSYMTYGIITEASSRTRYSNPILGWVCKHLFELIPGFNWQTLIFYLSLLFAGTVGWAAIIKKNNKKILFLCSLFFIVFYYDVYIKFTFTTISTMITCMGYLALFFAVEDKDNSNRILRFVCSGISLALGVVIRFESFFAISAFAALVWLLFVVSDYIETKDIKKLLSKYLFPFVAIIGFCMALYVVDIMSYSHGEWKEYRDYEMYREAVSDRRTAASMGDIETLDSLGVTMSAAKQILCWRNNDPEVLSPEVVKSIAETEGKYSYITSPYVWHDFFDQFKKMAVKIPEWYFCILVFSFYLAFVWKNEKVFWKKLIPLTLMGPMLVEIFWFALLGRIDGGLYPKRIVYTVLMGFFVGIICLMMKNEYSEGDSLATQKGKVCKYVMLAALFVSVVIVQPQKDFSIDGLGLVDTEDLDERYGFFGRGSKIYVCEYAVRMEMENKYGAWQTPEAEAWDLMVPLGTWLINHPMYIKHQADLGVENPYRALFERDDVYFICTGDPNGMVLTYLQENYDERIKCDYVKRKEEYKLYRFYIEE